MQPVESGAIHLEILINATPERVFAALTDPAQLASWWGSDDLYRTFDWKIDLRAGGSWSCQARSKEGHLSTVHGTYLEVTPPRVLAYTWNPSWDPIPETRIRFELAPENGGTRLVVRHEGFEGYAESRQGHTFGWHRVLSWLQTFSEPK
jgi:uncharacterized protein YndB with AHSA1/START domain